MQRLVLSAVILALLLAAAASGGRLFARPDPIVQPIAFDHARHAEEDLGCLDCHAPAATGAYATLPLLSTCLLCHAEALGESPEEARLLEFVESGEEIPWVQVNRSAGHVFFHHAAHVTLGKMECSECHGDMALASEPPGASQIDGLTMRRCMDCHRERGVTNDCIACHK
jgi:hypothetical protein